MVVWLCLPRHLQGCVHYLVNERRHLDGRSRAASRLLEKPTAGTPGQRRQVGSRGLQVLVSLKGFPLLQRKRACDSRLHQQMAATGMQAAELGWSTGMVGLLLTVVLSRRQA